jgi:probable HAF family extracellular repeat protein
MKSSVLIALGIIIFASLSFAAQNPSAAFYDVSELPTAEGTLGFGPRKINNRGDVLGKLTVESHQGEVHAGLFSQGTNIDLHLLVPGGDTNHYSGPIALNDNGQVLFYAYGGISWDRFFFYEQGHIVDLNEVLGRNDLAFVAMNNAGALVGVTIVSNREAEAFLYADGKIQTFGTLPNAPQSGATAINDHGRILGWAGVEDEPENSRHVEFRGGHISVLPRLPREGYVLGLNNRGDILGTIFLKRGGRISKIPAGSIFQIPFQVGGFNNRGEVVGSVFDIDSPLSVHAGLFFGRKMRDLNELIDPASGWKLFYAHDINDKGQIVGYGRLNDHDTAFIMTPKKRSKQSP